MKALPDALSDFTNRDRAYQRVHHCIDYTGYKKHIQDITGARLDPFLFDSMIEDMTEN